MVGRRRLAGRSKSVPYQEGTWFAVPLRDGQGYAVGLVARMDGEGTVCGYFFGPRRAGIPLLDELCGLEAVDAIWIRRFGDLSLLRGDWPIVGQCHSWRREDWPLPLFARIQESTGLAWIVAYDEETLDFLREDICDPGLVASYPSDGLSGAGAVEIRLTKELTPVAENRSTGSAPEEIDAPKQSSDSARTIAHFLYFSTAHGAAQVAAELMRRGFHTEERVATDGVRWLLIVRHDAIPTDETISSTQHLMEGLIVGVGGEYDGWEIDWTPGRRA